MVDVILFHHALGLTPGVHAFADLLREAGHSVHTPDLFDGQTFDTVEAGVAHAQGIGFGEIVGRGQTFAETLPANVVYAGISLGVLPAQVLAQTRPGALAGLFISACLPAEGFGGWPDNLPAHIHAMEADPIFSNEDVAAAEALVASSEDTELFLYPGEGHLFIDSGFTDYDEDATRLLVRRVLRFLAAAS